MGSEAPSTGISENNGRIFLNRRGGFRVSTCGLALRNRGIAGIVVWAFVHDRLVRCPQTHLQRTCAMRNSESTNMTRRSGSRGFTLPEVLAVVAVIALLIALIMPALTGAMRTSELAKSQNNMKQISLWMTTYSGENRDL